MSNEKQPIPQQESQPSGVKDSIKSAPRRVMEPLTDPYQRRKLKTAAALAAVAIARGTGIAPGDGMATPEIGIHASNEVKTATTITQVDQTPNANQREAPRQDEATRIDVPETYDLLVTDQSEIQTSYNNFVKDLTGILKPESIPEPVTKTPPDQLAQSFITTVNVRDGKTEANTAAYWLNRNVNTSNDADIRTYKIHIQGEPDNKWDGSIFFYVNADGKLNTSEKAVGITLTSEQRRSALEHIVQQPITWELSDKTDADTGKDAAGNSYTVKSSGAVTIITSFSKDSIITDLPKDESDDAKAAQALVYAKTAEIDVAGSVTGKDITDATTLLTKAEALTNLIQDPKTEEEATDALDKQEAIVVATLADHVDPADAKRVTEITDQIRNPQIADPLLAAAAISEANNGSGQEHIQEANVLAEQITDRKLQDQVKASINNAVKLDQAELNGSLDMTLEQQGALRDKMTEDSLKYSDKATRETNDLRQKVAAGFKSVYARVFKSETPPKTTEQPASPQEGNKPQ